MRSPRKGTGKSTTQFSYLHIVGRMDGSCQIWQFRDEFAYYRWRLRTGRP